MPTKRKSTGSSSEFVMVPEVTGKFNADNFSCVRFNGDNFENGSKHLLNFNGRKRAAYVSKGDFHVHPDFLFNAVNQVPKRFSELMISQMKNPQPPEVLSSETCRRKCKRIEVKTVKSFDYEFGRDYDTLISLFLKGKIVCLGDVLSLDTRDFPLCFQPKLLTNEYQHNFPNIFIKITEVKDFDGVQIPHFVVPDDETDIVWSGFTEAFHPSFQRNELLPFTLSLYPVEPLVAILQKFLTVEKDKQVGSVLLRAASTFDAVKLADICARFCCLSVSIVSALNLSNDSLALTIPKLENLFKENATNCLPCCIIINEIEDLYCFTSNKNEHKSLAYKLDSILKSIKLEDAQTFIVIGVTSESTELLPEWRAIWKEYFYLSLPSSQRNQLAINWIKNEAKINISTNPKLNGWGIDAFHCLASKIRREDNESLRKGISSVNTTISSVMGGGSIPDVDWDSVGGLQDVRQELKDTLDPPNIANSAFKRKGILLHGPPGCGKTLVAKALASERSQAFFPIKGPELLSAYVGQSESNIRDLFTRARQIAPVIVFFDEIDSIAPARGRSGDSGGVMDRVVSSLLAEIDGISSNQENVYIIGATNRPDLVDSALMRPGRLDRSVFVGPPENVEDRIAVLKAHTRKLPLAEDFSIEKVEEHCPKRLSGAQLASVCKEAARSAIRRSISKKSEISVLLEDFTSQDLSNLSTDADPELQLKSDTNNQDSDVNKLTEEIMESLENEPSSSQS